MLTLQDGKGAAEVAEWHSKMQNTRLQHLKLSQKINRLQELVTSIMLVKLDVHEGRGVGMGEVDIDLAGW